jgi:proteic killer suppression protein
MILDVIRSFADRDTERLFGRRFSRRLPRDLQKAALRKLELLDAARTLDSLRVPAGNKLEALRGDRAGHYSIRINDQWRVCFRWKDEHAYEVEIVDYH